MPFNINICAKRLWKILKNKDRPMNMAAGIRVAALNGIIETKQGQWVGLEINALWRLSA